MVVVDFLVFPILVGGYVNILWVTQSMSGEFDEIEGRNCGGDGV